MSEPGRAARRHLIAGLVVLAGIGALGACSSATPAASTAATSAEVSRSAPTTAEASTTSSTPSPTPTPGSAPPSGSAAGTATTTPSPAPSTAGMLNSGTVPRKILTFTADNQAQAGEGEFNPNGTFVHQVNAADASLAALPGCGSGSGSVPRARDALAAAYLDPSTRQLGNVIQLRFATAREAASWLSEFVAQVRQCPRVDMAPVVTAGTVQDRRASVGIVWSEAGVRNDATVTLAALQGSHDTGRILSALH